MTIKEKILKIMALALEINPPGINRIGEIRTAVFVHWSPHCNLFELYIHENGWRGFKSGEHLSVYTDAKAADHHLDAMIARLEEIKTEYKENENVRRMQTESV